MKNIFITLIIVFSAACDLKGKEGKVEERINEINFDLLPSISGADTIEFNKNIIAVGTEKTINRLGSWFQLSSGSTNLYYLIEEKIVDNYRIHELKVYNSQSVLMGRQLLEDTSFIFKAPERRTTIVYRNANWLFLESGLISSDSLIILKSEKIEIKSLLDSSYDSHFVKN